MFLQSLIDGVTERFSTEYEVQQVRLCRSMLKKSYTFVKILKEDCVQNTIFIAKDNINSDHLPQQSY